jgi:tetratricopeptide (TPR) repeat protein
VRAELLSLSRHTADTVARHLVATGRLIDDDPEEALSHALAARRLASRVAAVREAVGLAAYRAGEWQTAIGELRTYHRMTGRQTHLAVLADCERALGRPERAIDLYRGADRDALAPAEAVELLIVAAGARGDLGQKDAAVTMLQVRELAAPAEEPWAARLRYAYADALLAADRRDEAREWFARAADADEDSETDAAERLLELDGVVIEGDENDDEDELADEYGPDDDAKELPQIEADGAEVPDVDEILDAEVAIDAEAADEAGDLEAVSDALESDALESDALESDALESDAPDSDAPDSDDDTAATDEAPETKDAPAPRDPA